MVGGWSRRKGADLIVDAILQTGLGFLHVGAIVDFPFPDSPQFTHVDPVDQPSLLQYYNLAKIFLLPSREEGLSMVQVQALACNLPIIGSMNSGAYDLKQRVEDPRFITLIKDWTVSAVVDAINETISFYPQLKGKKYAGTALEDLTWQAYGQRYAKNLHNIMKS